VRCGRHAATTIPIGGTSLMADIPKQDNALSKLFSPIQIGTLQVKNRLAMAPIGTVYSSYDGALRREFKDFILARAKGGVGMIMPGERDLRDWRCGGTA